MQDYRKQNLQGRSFRGQNLAGADFSGTDVRGADFREADLTGTTFYEARMGKTLRRKILMFVVSGLIGCSYGFLCAISLNFIFFLVSRFSEILTFEPTITVRLIAVLAYTLLSILSVLVALNQRKWSPIGFWHMGLTMLIGATSGALNLTIALGVAAAVIGTIATATMVSVTGTGSIVGAIVGSVTIAATGAGLITGPLAFSGAAAGATIWLAFGHYLKWRSLKYEESMLHALRHHFLFWQGWGGTDFRGAKLTTTNFSKADTHHAQFTDTLLIGCQWLKSQNLHLADTRGTLLELRAARLLLSRRDVGTKDFSYNNLRGAALAGFDLRSVNFHHADLSQADLRDCNLSDCDLSEAMALGSDFTHANFTGALIENWNIDKTTCFDGAACKFVYLKRDKSERNPPQGEFAEGDFAKLYQEIANTVDFIAHTPLELQALLRAIEAIKKQGGGIFLQQMERKADSVVLRVQSESDVAIDKAQIYAEVERQKQTELLALRQEYEQKLFHGELKLNHEKELRAAEKENKDLLAQLLKSAVEKPISFENHFMTQDHSRRIENSTLNQSNANLGDHSNQNLHIEQLLDSELKALLQQLGKIIDDAPLSKQDRQTVESQFQQLTGLAQQPQPEAKTEITKTIGRLKDLTSIFKDLPEIGLKYGALLAQLALMF